MNKNPFEIRAEMLQLAKEYMDQQYHMNIQFLENMIYEAQKANFFGGKKAREEIEEQLKEAYKMYSMEDLMAKAKEMYSFVSTKD